MSHIPTSKNLFVGLSDFSLWPDDSIIKIKPSKKYRTEKKHQNHQGNDDVHPLSYKKSNKILKALKIKQSDKIFVYDFNLNSVKIFKVKNHLPLLSYQSPYDEEEYYFGFKINQKKIAMKDQYYSHNYLIYIGKENPFYTKNMQRIKWKKISNKDFPTSKFIREHALKNALIDDEDYKEGKDPWGNPLWIRKSYTKNTYHFSKDNLEYYLYFFTRNEETLDNDGVTTVSKSPSYLIQVKRKTGPVIFSSFHKSSESVTVSPFKEETKSQWTGKLFKDKAPIYFNTIESYSFGCRSIEIIDKSSKPIPLLCDNRH